MHGWTIRSFSLAVRSLAQMEQRVTASSTSGISGCNYIAHKLVMLRLSYLLTERRRKRTTHSCSVLLTSSLNRPWLVLLVNYGKTGSQSPETAGQLTTNQCRNGGFRGLKRKPNLQTLIVIGTVLSPESSSDGATSGSRYDTMKKVFDAFVVDSHLRLFKTAGHGEPTIVRKQTGVLQPFPLSCSISLMPGQETRVTGELRLNLSRNGSMS
jgi:hypothetical protein